MRVLCFASVALVAVFPMASGADDDTKKAEAKWARGVADDFFAAMKKGETESAVGLLTAEYASSIAGKGSAAEALRRLLGTTAFTFEKATVTGESISPDKDEVQLKGELVRASNDATESVSAFVLRVVKEKETGRWRIGFVRTETSVSRPIPKK
jgi:hypothetical protein